MPDDPERRSLLVHEINKLLVDVLYSEVGHFCAAASAGRRQRFLATMAAVLAAAAGTILVARINWIVAAVLSFGAAVFATLDRTLNLAMHANQHHGAGVNYAALRRKLAKMGNVRLAPNDCRRVERAHSKLVEQISSLQRSSPPLPRSAYDKAKKQILDEGTRNYTAKELNAAIGEG